MRNIGPFGLENRIFAGICGLGALLLSLVLFGWGFFGALIFGIIVGVIVLMWLLMRDGDAAGSNSTHTTSHGATGAGTASASHGATSTPQTGGADTGSAQASGAGDTATTTQAASAATSEKVEAPTAAPAATSTKAEAPSETPAATSEKAEAPAATAAPKAEAAKETAPKVKDSTTLPGEDDLASRKGDWKYEGGDAEPEAAPAAAKAAPAATKAAPAAKEATKKPAKTKAKAADAATDGGNKDYDGDGVIEGENEGSKPTTLTAARDGGADDLKQIKGVGPKMEGMLNGMGFFHFDQVAAWTGAEVAWVDANLKGFRGRVSRDNWVDQAKTLAAGGETEFSKKVEKGGVY